MFWTRWTRGVCTLFLFIGVVIAAFIAYPYFDSEDFALGFIIYLATLAIFFTAVSLVMTLCEISENINKILNDLHKTSNDYQNNNHLHIDPSFTNKADKDDFEVCSCGTTNKSTANLCENCDKEPFDYLQSFNSSSRQVELSSEYAGQSTWTCIKCGKINPLSSQACKDCGHN